RSRRIAAPCAIACSAYAKSPAMTSLIPTRGSTCSWPRGRGPRWSPCAGNSARSTPSDRLDLELEDRVPVQRRLVDVQRFLPRELGVFAGELGARGEAEAGRAVRIDEPTFEAKLEVDGSKDAAPQKLAFHMRPVVAVRGPPDDRRAPAAESGHGRIACDLQGIG